MIYKVIIISLLAISFILSQPGSLLAARGVELIISSDKNEYALTDPIYIIFKLKNKAKKPVYVNQRMYVSSKEVPKEGRDIFLTVISPSGEELLCKTSNDTGYPRTDHFLLLDPGQEIERERKQGVKHLFDFKEAGKYKITATYENVYGDEIGIDAFKERIESKPITIRIVEAKKEEEKKK
jgi:hypothetical protein